MFRFLVLIVSIGYDITIAISTSKMRNRRATRKNWKENGIWEGAIELNPHSNGPLFSFDMYDFFCTV